MAYITGPDVVKYACTCGLLKPISQLYFCRYCCQLRCGFCVCHEVDSHFCGKCCENLPSSEARLKKNRCGNCYVCPSCQQELSTRIGSKGPSNPDDPKSTPKKMYYLSCLYCRWSSRDVGIPDQSAATGGWPDRENVHANRLQEIIDMYKAVVLAEKQQKEKDKKKQRGKYLSYTDRTGVTAASLRKRIGLPADIQHSLLKTKPKEPEPVIPKEEVEDLPEDIFTKLVKLMEVTTIEQRLLQTDVQPITVDMLFPIHKQLSIKRSLRCRSCEHNVSKPEYNPNSVKFKIQLFAYYHIPEIRIVTVEPLRAGRASELIVKFTNPTQHQTTIAFLPLDSVAEEAVGEEASFNQQEASFDAIKQSASLTSLSSQPSSLLSLSSRQPSITIKPRAIVQEVTADVAIPASKVILPPRDDAAEYDDSGDTHNIQDDPKLVVWRRSNKAFVKLLVTPRENLPINTEVIIGFTMQHVYTNTIATTVENKEPDKHDHNIKVFLTIGNLVGSD
ncbi:dynactin subunit 4 [Asbolus verrucosus]|uniref:Dynactin subunit 4 n=1 Tax=Asbolus verrucosus TaxID=1661398 RepID=A0A482W1Y0_ASBVE|nr:dynactin subunit 4 [Asbolus verrucosus]